MNDAGRPCQRALMRRRPAGLFIDYRTDNAINQRTGLFNDSSAALFQGFSQRERTELTRGAGAGSE